MFSSSSHVRAVCGMATDCSVCRSYVRLGRCDCSRGVDSASGLYHSSGSNKRGSVGNGLLVRVGHVGNALPEPEG